MTQIYITFYHTIVYYVMLYYIIWRSLPAGEAHDLRTLRARLPHRPAPPPPEGLYF